MDAHVGTWKLVSCFMQDVGGGELGDELGRQPVLPIGPLSGMGLDVAQRIGGESGLGGGLAGIEGAVVLRLDDGQEFPRVVDHGLPSGKPALGFVERSEGLVSGIGSADHGLRSGRLSAIGVMRASVPASRRGAASCGLAAGVDILTVSSL